MTDKKKNLKSFLFLNCFFSIYFIILSYISKQTLFERIYFSVNIGISFYFISQLLWGIVFYYFFCSKWNNLKIKLITIIIMLCSFIAGILLEFFWMYDNIKF